MTTVPFSALEGSSVLPDSSSVFLRPEQSLSAICEFSFISTSILPSRVIVKHCEVSLPEITTLQFARERFSETSISEALALFGHCLTKDSLSMFAHSASFFVVVSCPALFSTSSWLSRSLLLVFIGLTSELSPSP